MSYITHSLTWFVHWYETMAWTFTRVVLGCISTQQWLVKRSRMSGKVLDFHPCLHQGTVISISSIHWAAASFCLSFHGFKTSKNHSTRLLPIYYMGYGKHLQSSAIVKLPKIWPIRDLFRCRGVQCMAQDGYECGLAQNHKFT